MGRILKSRTADELIARMKEDIAEIDDHLAHIVDYTVNYQMLKNKYGANFLVVPNCVTSTRSKPPRVRQRKNFTSTAKKDFIGTALKKDEFVANCSISTT